MVLTSIGCFTIAAASSGSPGSLLRALATGFIAAIALLIIALAFPGQLGLGDVALAGGVTLNLGWLSWQAAAAGMTVAFILQGTAALAVRAQGRRGGLMPMGPALVGGWLIGVISAAA
jgi:leader peptidase (prepilin peptidase)/N-methyltransferase